jgi:Holliday junction resolvase RusA-like endonuclease
MSKVGSQFAQMMTQAFPKEWTEQERAKALPSLADPPFAVAPDPGQPVTIFLAGTPQGKGRARAFRRGSFIGHYTPEKTRSYEGMIRSAAMDAMAGRMPFEEPVELTMRAIFAVPVSWSKRQKARAILHEIKPAKKPDYDNILKAWSDAMNTVVFRDDALIVRVEFEKVYGHQPVVVVTVKPA